MIPRFTVFRCLTPDEADFGRHAEAYNEVRENTYAANKVELRMWVEVPLDIPDWPTTEDLSRFVHPNWLMGARFLIVDNTTGHSRTVDLTVARTYSLVNVEGI